MMQPKSAQSPKYINNPYKSAGKKKKNPKNKTKQKPPQNCNNPVEKQAGDLLDISPKKTHTWPTGTCKILNITNYQTNANQNYNDVPLHTSLNGYNQ